MTSARGGDVTGAEWAAAHGVRPLRHVETAETALARCRVHQLAAGRAEDAGDWRKAADLWRAASACATLALQLAHRPGPIRAAVLKVRPE